ncbi:MAG: alpha/beta hydrolase [Bacteroidetes bacterium]|nr:alpha/beta hydrolase [Bacteroidota bacterium]
MTKYSAKSSKLFYRKFGSGPAIVLLHGFPESGILWQQVWPDLAERFTVLVPDLPGSGQSSRGTEKITMESMADAVDGMLEAESLNGAVFAGHSMGGYVSLAFAAKYGRKVKGLSMVHSTAFADDEEKKNNRRKVIELIRKGGREAFIRQMIPALFSPSTKETRPGIIEKQVESGLQLEADSQVAYYEAMIERPERTDMLTGGRFPVQWIIGKDDTVVPFTKGLQQCTLTSINFVSVYNMCGHMSMLENNKELVKNLADFASYCLRR